jgi:hypothetical protein
VSQFVILSGNICCYNTIFLNLFLIIILWYWG